MQWTCKKTVENGLKFLISQLYPTKCNFEFEKVTKKKYTKFSWIEEDCVNGAMTCLAAVAYSQSDEDNFL